MCQVRRFSAGDNTCSKMFPVAEQHLKSHYTFVLTLNKKYLNCPLLRVNFYQLNGIFSILFFVVIFEEKKSHFVRATDTPICDSSHLFLLSYMPVTWYNIYSAPVETNYQQQFNDRTAQSPGPRKFLYKEPINCCWSLLPALLTCQELKKIMSNVNELYETTTTVFLLLI